MRKASARSTWSGLTSTALLLVATYLGWSRDVGAQEPSLARARLAGVVLEESTDRPIEFATVSLVGTTFEVRTGASGAFALPEAPVGRVSLRIAARGHPSVVELFEISADSAVFLRVRLPSVAAVLSEVFVQGVRHEQPAIDAARTAADLLALRVPSARTAPGVVGTNGRAIHLRGANTVTQTVEPLVLIDGVAVSSIRNAMDALALIRAADVQAIQVLLGTAAAFVYPNASNGVVLVTTKRGG